MFFVQTHFFALQMLKCLSSLESFGCIDNDVNTESIAALAEHLYENIEIISCFSQTWAHILSFVCAAGCVFVDQLTEKYLSCMSSSVMFCQEGVRNCWDPPNNSQFPESSRPWRPPPPLLVTARRRQICVIQSGSFHAVQPLRRDISVMT